jgi:hypothetical protein
MDSSRVIVDCIPVRKSSWLQTLLRSDVSLSYDASYLLVLAGILMLLLAVIRHRAKKLLLLGSLFSALPIIALIISQSL